MDAEGKEDRKAARRIRPVNVDHHRDAVAHRHGHVLVADDALKLRRPPIVGGRLMAGGEKLFGGANFVFFHWPPTMTHINSAGSRPVLSQEWPTPRCTTAS